MRSDRSLYQCLNDFALDDESASYKFSDRLAKENGWTLAFAKGAIAEYKKFVYLAATSPTPVTPSNIIDQVWHLHLTYTRSYWSEMCHGILGKPLHHGPTKGGRSEDNKYRELYAATLDAYRREFGEEPPRAFWPASDARFESAVHQRWVDTRTHAVVAWRTLGRATAAIVGTVTLSSAGLAFAAANSKAYPEKLWIGVGAIGFLTVVILVVSFTRGRSARGNGNGDGGAYYGGDTGGSSNNHHHGTDSGHGHGGHGGDSSGGHGSCSGGGSDGGGSGCSGGGCSGGGCSGSS